MRLHTYLEQVIGNKTVIILVRTMLEYKGKVFTIRQLAKTAGVSPSETSVLVKELEEAGIVKLQPVGRSYLITLNEQSFVLRKILKPAFRAEKDTMEELFRLLRASFQYSWIISVDLFGSVVRGDEKKDSDIDTLIISNDFDRASALASRAQAVILAVFNKQLAPVIFSQRELDTKRRENNKLVENIEANHIHILGKDLFSK